MKKLFSMILFSLFAMEACQKVVDCSVPAKIIDGQIVLETPKRGPEQKSALKLKCEPIDTVRVGIIGIGMRGREAVSRYTRIDGAKVTAICDIREKCIEKGQSILSKHGCDSARTYSGEDGWKRLCESGDVDLVYVCTPWLQHTPMAVYAMECGKHVAVEVPAAMTIDECWQLVNTCEKTRRHCMMLENGCYDFFEMISLNMAQQGLFGEVYHAEGAYIHNLDWYWAKYSENWRMVYNQANRGDNYPTHGIGPVCQVLGIHRGDRMDYVVAQDTKSIHGVELAQKNMNTDQFADGDHTVSLIRTVNGHQIEIQHNVYGCRPYSRMYQLSGTKGFANKYPVEGFCINGSEDFVSDEEFKTLCDKYQFNFVKEIEERARQIDGGHGGCDYIMDYRLIYCLRNGLPLDEDVYDAAEWSCLTELSGLSIKYGSMPVKVPDFTRGDWDILDKVEFESTNK